jgi:hypothetical protein
MASRVEIDGAGVAPGDAATGDMVGGILSAVTQKFRKEHHSSLEGGTSSCCRTRFDAIR